VLQEYLVSSLWEWVSRIFTFMIAGTVIGKRVLERVSERAFLGVCLRGQRNRNGTRWARLHMPPEAERDLKQRVKRLCGYTQIPAFETLPPHDSCTRPFMATGYREPYWNGEHTPSAHEE
jgi:hypothetical protein